MAFWGVHLKPGKPFTHRFDKLKGRIRISQATLGAGGASSHMSAVQCTVGDNDPIRLCAFFPSKKVSCSLDLEFEEEDDVVFKVTGPRSVYLAGFYMRNFSSEKVITENKIVEVGGDCDTLADRSTIHAAHVSDEGTIYEQKKRKMTEAQKSIENANTEDDGKQISEYQESIAADVSDEGYKLERKKKKKMTEAQTSIENTNTEDDVKHTSELQESIAANISDEGNKHERKKKKKKMTEAQKSIENTNTEDDGKQMSELQESIAAHASDEGYKHERKKKKKKITEAQKSIEDANTGDEEKQMSEPQESIKTENSEDEVKKMSIAAHVSDEGNRHVRKKKMTEAQKSIENLNTEDEGKRMSEPKESNRTISTEEEEKKMSEPQESIAAHVNDEVNRRMQKKKKMSEVQKSIQNGNTDDELKKTEAENANTEDDEKKVCEPQKSNENANTKDDEKQTSEPQESIKTANTEDGEKKMIEAEESIKTAITEDEEHKMSEDQQSIKTAITEEGVMKEVIPLQERSFSNGMVITDLAYGKGEGEGASPGSRVTVNYISYRDGKIIDSKLDGSFKFRLGAKKVIKGLDVGINGMRIGDKRRLTIPPSMTTDGKEEFAAGKGKSYLICDVELVNIK